MENFSIVQKYFEVLFLTRIAYRFLRRVKNYINIRCRMYEDNTQEMKAHVYLCVVCFVNEPLLAEWKLCQIYSSTLV